MISQCCAQQKLLYASDDSGDESDGDDNAVFFNIVQNGGGVKSIFRKFIKIFVDLGQSRLMASKAKDDFLFKCLDSKRL